MKKVLLLCFLSLGALAVSISGQERDFPPEGCVMPPFPPDKVPAFPSADFYRTVTKTGREIRGILQTGSMPETRRPFPAHYMSFLMTGLDGAVSVNGKMYPLDFGTNLTLRQRARTLNGKRVFLQGQVETRHLPLVPHSEGKPGDGTFQTIEYVLVSSVEEIEEYVRETIEVDVQGRFDADALLGFDGTNGPVIHVQGKTFVLDLSKVGIPLSMSRWTGKTVRLQATLGDWRSYVGPMVPDAPSPKFRVLHVREIRLVTEAWIVQREEIEIGGLVQLYRHMKFGRGAVAISVGGQPYYLDFGKQDHLYDLAGKASNAGQTVTVIGRLRPADGAIEVLNLEIVPEKEHYDETISVEIKGFLQEAPHQDVFLELASDRPLTLQVNVNGRVLTLYFGKSTRLERYSQDMVGSSVIVRGRLGGAGVHVSELQPVFLMDRMMPWEAFVC